MFIEGSSRIENLANIIKKIQFRLRVFLTNT